jgi:hypothetical protein
MSGHRDTAVYLDDILDAARQSSRVYAGTFIQRVRE